MSVHACFADLLEYPDETLAPRLAACLASCGVDDEAAGAAVGRFREETDRLGLPALQELYTATFDLDASCALYAGHQLFGETPRRSAFMARLAGDYRQAGYRCLEHEPPDYLPVMLRYLDRCDELREPSPAREETRRALLADVILPASRKVLDTLRSRGNPYALVLGALVAHLEIPA